MMLIGIPPGSVNIARGASFRHRSRGSAAQVAAYANNLAIVLTVSA
jgi:hypothetical protein